MTKSTIRSFLRALDDAGLKIVQSGLASPWQIRDCQKIIDRFVDQKMGQPNPLVQPFARHHARKCQEKMNKGMEAILDAYMVAETSDVLEVSAQEPTSADSYYTVFWEVYHPWIPRYRPHQDLYNLAFSLRAKVMVECVCLGKDENYQALEGIYDTLFSLKDIVAHFDVQTSPYMDWSDMVWRNTKFQYPFVEQTFQVVHKISLDHKVSREEALSALINIAEQKPFDTSAIYQLRLQHIPYMLNNGISWNDEHDCLFKPEAIDVVRHSAGYKKQRLEEVAARVETIRPSTPKWEM